VAWASLTNSTVPSSSVMEKTDTPTQTGSPASSHTSLSVASTKDGNDVGLNKEVDSMSAEETPSNILVSAEKPVQHVFCQFGVADYGVLSTFSSVIRRVGEGTWGCRCFGWVGC